jgi:hypothetical protein
MATKRFWMPAAWMGCALGLFVGEALGASNPPVTFYIPPVTPLTLPSVSNVAGNSKPAEQGKPIFIGNTRIYFNTKAGTPISYYQGDFSTYIGYSPSSGVSFPHAGYTYGGTPSNGSGLATGPTQVTDNGLLIYTGGAVSSGPAPVVPVGGWIDLNDLIKNQADAPLPRGALALHPVSPDGKQAVALSWIVE